MSLLRRALASLLAGVLAFVPTLAQAAERSVPVVHVGGRPVIGLGAAASLPSISLPSLPVQTQAALSISLPQIAQGAWALHPVELQPQALSAQPISAQTPMEAALAPALPAEAQSPFEAIRQAERQASGRKIVESAREQGFALEPVRLDDPTSSAGTPAAPSSGGSGLVPSGPNGGDGGGSRGEPPAPRKPSNRGPLGFLASLLIAQAGVETAGLAVPQLANQLAGSFQAASLLPTVAFLALMAGSLAGGALVDRKGVRGVYLGLFVLRTGAAVALAATGVAGAMTFPLLVGLFGVDYFFLGATRVAEAVVPAALYSGRGKVAGFSNFQQMVIESMGVLGLTAGGLAIATAGLHGALAGYAAAIGLGSVVAWITLRPRFFGAAAPQAKTERAPGIREVWTALKAAPRLRGLTGAYVLNIVLAGYVYFAVAPAFGLFAGKALGASATTFWSTALFAAGGFSGTILGAWLNARRDRKLAGLSAEARDAAERESLLNQAAGWSKALSLVLILGGWTLAAAGLIGPWAAFAFMFPFGVADIMAYVALESTLKTEAPASIRGSLVGYAKAAAQLLAAVTFPLIGWAFDLLSPAGAQGHTPSTAAFALVGAIFAAVALATLRFVRRK